MLCAILELLSSNKIFQNGTMHASTQLLTLETDRGFSVWSEEPQTSCGPIFRPCKSQTPSNDTRSIRVPTSCPVLANDGIQSQLPSLDVILGLIRKRLTFHRTAIEPNKYKLAREGNLRFPFQTRNIILSWTSLNHSGLLSSHRSLSKLALSSR